MSRRTNAQIDADTMRETAKLMRAYGVPVTANVLDVVADSVEKGDRKKC